MNVCNTLPVFSDKRLVVLEDVDKFTKFKVLEDYISSPSLNTVLILNSDERNLKQLKNKQNIITVIFYSLFDNQLVQWVMNKCRQNKKNITGDAARELIHLCDNSLLEIDNEVEKLLIYCKDKEQVTRDDVEKLIGDIKGYDIYKLIDAILSSKYQLSLRIFKKLWESGSNIYSSFSLLNKSLHDIYLIKFLLEIEKLNSREIIKKLSMKEYRYKNIAANIRKYNLDRISQTIIVLFEFEYKFKSYTAVNTNRLFEELIYRLKLK